MGKKKAALYTRVSTEDQAKEGFSLDAQLDKLRAYCTARDWNIVGEYVDDGYSGRNTRRPAYKKLLDDIHKWDMLLVIKMDRIHRNSKNFMLMIIQRIAQLESEQIGERVYDGMAQKARTNGGSLGFNIPYGYNYENNELIVDKKEATIVKDIFNLYVDGLSMNKIAEHLNEKNIPTKQNRTWRAQTISKILKNPLYCGTFHWDEYEHEKVYPSIVSKKLFNNCQFKINNK